MQKHSIHDLCLLIANNNDQSAFEKLFVQFYPKLLVFVRNYCGNRESAEEIVEDVFVKLWENRESLPAIRNLQYYLFVTAKNITLNHLAKVKAMNFVEIEDNSINYRSIALNPEELLISGETLDHIRSVINHLPPKCKIVFELVKENGLKYHEAADVLNLSVKTIEAHMTMAVRKITQYLIEADRIEVKPFLSPKRWKV